MKRKIFFCFSLFVSQLSFAQNGTWFWGKYGINTGPGTGSAVATDNSGNCYLAGYLSNHDTIHFGSYTVMNTTVNHVKLDMYLVKFDHNGNVQWARQTVDSGAGGGGDGPHICTDKWGNVYLASDFADTLIIGANKFIQPKGYLSAFIVKYAPNGTIKWAKRSTISIKDTGEGENDEHISCDLNGNVFLSGAISDTVYFGSYMLVGTSPIFAFNSYLVKYDSNGNVLWARQSVYPKTANNSDVSWANTTDRLGNSFLTGIFGDTTSFGSFQLIGDYNGDFYLVKYDPNGNVVWAEQNTEILGGSSIGVSLATDLTGNVYALGQFDGGVVFNSHDTLIAGSQGSFFVVKYDANGNYLWSEEAIALDNNTWTAWTISIDNSKHIYLIAGGYGGGKGTGEIALGGDTISVVDTAAYDGPSAIFKLDSNGKAVCSSIIPVGGAQQPDAIASDTSGNYVYIGTSAITVGVFGKDTIDPFVYPPNPIYGLNELPFVARWQECDSNVLYAAVQNQKPIEGNVKVYPNPNNGVFTIALQNVNEPCQVEVYNVLGEKILSQSLLTNNTNVNISNQPAGVYLIRVLNVEGGLVGQSKIIKE